MGVTWTKEQQQVIDTRNRNLLVSAAAGSGKTAVLVERILSRITDKKDPVNIDELLIVTFTRAAAGEMRERIGAALAKALEADPDNEHLEKQQTLLHHAQINTIHSFCAYVIQNYFTLIGLDPAYRMGDEGEMKLLKQDVAAKLLEQYYGQADPGFLNFIETYAPGKNDSKITDLILKVYEFAESNPQPEKYYEESQRIYHCSLEEMQESPVWKAMLEDAGRILFGAEQEIRENLQTLKKPDAPFWYESAVQSDLLYVEELRKKKTYEELRQAMGGWVPARLGRAPKGSAASDLLTQQIKNRREEYKKQLKGLQEGYFSSSLSDLQESLELCREPVSWLVRLAREFGEELAAEKRRKNILDFSDLEHLALQILVKPSADNPGTFEKTDAARELASRFKEIMIDEYQDSNLIQEVLLEAVSGRNGSCQNRFMVGDIKQSIYGFRLARPDLFLSKYHAYRESEQEGVRIDLARNFRSRREVLESANLLFEQLMCEQLGGISYDQAAALYVGADYPENPDKDANRTELLLVSSLEKPDDPLSGAEFNLQSDMEAEAACVAGKIRSLVGQMDVLDKETKTYRKATYGDIVILLRTVSGWADTFLQILQSMDIPSYTASGSGYFSTVEIVTILNYLRICDNPMQDIPLCAVLHSPIGAFGEEELAAIRIAQPEGDLYSALCQYADPEHTEQRNEELAEKAARFLTTLNTFRDRVSYTPIHTLLEQILTETDYLAFAGAMPSGAQRRANLEMLVEKATEYEQTSYHGLFHFVRYIEQLQKYEVDYGEVNVNGENTDAVRIMSIHKSKGLEFPIVIVSGLGKQFNMMDANSSLVLSSELGIGAEAVDPVLRVKAKTFPQKVISNTIRRENLAEELRVLYVALTRAKEKLIMTGVLKKPADTLLKIAAKTGYQETILPLSVLEGSHSNLEWILYALARCDAMQPVFKQLDIITDQRPADRRKPDLALFVSLVFPEQLVEEELFQRMNLENQKAVIYQELEQNPGDPAFAELLRDRFDFEYPENLTMQLPVKVSVSELKKEGMEESEEGVRLHTMAESEEIIPSFALQQEKKKLSGSARGTAYHRLLEELVFSHAHTVSDVGEQVEKLVSEGKMEQDQADCIFFKDICALVNSGIGRRMEDAQVRGEFHAEQPFVLGVPASLAHEEWPEEEMLLVQGIIDVWFQEGEDIVLLDYKTDRVTPETKDILVKRYQKQLFYYKLALEQLTGYPVKEVHIYSIAIDEDILLQF